MRKILFLLVLPLFSCSFDQATANKYTTTPVNQGYIGIPPGKYNCTGANNQDYTFTLGADGTYQAEDSSGEYSYVEESAITYITWETGSFKNWNHSFYLPSNGAIALRKNEHDRDDLLCKLPDEAS